MKLRALLAILGFTLLSFAPAYAKDKRPHSNNANVKRAMKKGKKTRPGKYKAPKTNRKQKRATYPQHTSTS